MQELLFNLLLLVVGFVFLIKGADFFVEGSAAVAKKLHVPTLIIGMTIVAMGTSAPECAVSISAAIKGANELALSNIIGSNMFNLMVVCGVCAILIPLTVQISTLKMEFPLSIFAGILLLITGFIGMSVGRVDGAIMMVLFIAFLVWMVHSAKKSREAETELEEYNENIKELSGTKCALYIVVGLVAIIFGGDVVVDSASMIASYMGLSQNLIGLTIVAIGTSLPELVTSLVAAKKKEVDMALGNVIGSNIFNILLIIGLAGVISPMVVTMENIIDLIALLIMSLIAYAFTLHKRSINRYEGIAMIAIYSGYMVYICMR
ncbi:MAG: calcium/sodium antiporter [Lachnospiraceae bacterium]